MLRQITVVQFVTPWYPMGKTSIESKLNIPGKIGWLTMEAPGFITLLYTVYSLPRELGLPGLPWANYTMAGMFVRPPTSPPFASAPHHDLETR